MPEKLACVYGNPRKSRGRGGKNETLLSQRCLPSLLGETLRRAGRASSSMGAPGQNPDLGQMYSGTEGSR